MSENDNSSTTSELEAKADEGADKKVSKPDVIPYKRFQTVIQERNDEKDQNVLLRAEVEAMKQAKKLEFNKDLERKGEYEILANQYKLEVEELRKQVDSDAKFKTVHRDLLLARLPEDKRELTSEMSMVDLARLVDIEEKNRVTPRQDPRPGERFGGYEDLGELAKRDPKAYLEAKKSGLIKD